MKYTILGGGTAGWLTALFINKHYPNDDVTVIASSEIGILGAGEGTTPHFITFLNQLGIDEKDIYENCKATIKTGIKFTNWNGEGDEYYHNFNCIGPDLHALHFDASLLAKYFQSLAISRGVKLIDDEVVDIKCKENKDVESFILKSGNVEHTDFVFDCSGFRRLIIGGLYKSEWIEYNMPCKRAIPFFLPNDNTNLPQYTESVAMKYGWIWKIPVQGRYGCGYVFDCTKTTDEEAKQEIRDYLGHDFVSPKTFNFNAGSYKDVWINNCLGVGLSSGFIEPLEATSIWIQIVTLNTFIECVGNKDKLNHDMKEMNEDILGFLYYHYMTKRTDSEFWSEFQKDNKMPEKLKMRLENKLITNNFNMFTGESWQTIKEGINHV
jgi:tryptophan halogenase